MRSRRVPICAALVALLSGAAGCQTARPQAGGTGEPELTAIVGELQVRLRDDTYRSRAHLDAQGRNAFELALWRLDRLKRGRATPEGEWANVDVVIEFARARALERLRRYDEAADAYAHVAASGSLLAAPALEAGAVMRRLAEHAGGWRRSDDGARLAALDARVAAWQSLAWELRESSYEALALQEAEAWGLLRIDAIGRQRGLDAALEATERLLERHRESKLYAEHLIRLGDLYAENARRERLRHRAQRADFDPARYDRHIDRALAAYELASEDRAPALRAMARQKIEALLASQRGIQARVP